MHIVLRLFSVCFAYSLCFAACILCAEGAAGDVYRISIQKENKGLSISLPTQDMPFALFKWKKRVWLGLPANAKVDIPASMPQGFHIAWKENVKGGKLLMIQTPKNVFPAFTDSGDGASDKNVSPCVVLTEKPAAIDLEQTFLDEMTFQHTNPQTVLIQTEIHQHIFFDEPSTKKRYHVLLNRQKGKGFGPIYREKEWRAHPTSQGLFLETVDNKTKVTTASITHKKHFQRKQTIKGAAPFLLKDFFGDSAAQIQAEHIKDNPRLVALVRIRRLLKQKKYPQALSELEALETLNSTVTAYPAFNALKGVALAFAGKKAESLATFARNTSLLKSSKPFHALLHAKNKDFSKTLRILDQYFPSIIQLPQPFKGDLLLLGAQSALVMGSPKKKALFLHSLSKDTLSNSQQTLKQLLQKSPLEYTKKNIEEGLWLPDTKTANPFWIAYHQKVAAKYQRILIKLNNRRINQKQAIEQLEMVAQEGRGGTIEAEVLKKLAELYEKSGNLVKALDTYRRFFRYASPLHPMRQYLRVRAQQIYLRGLYTKSWTALKRCAFFKRFQVFLPQGKQKEEVLTTFTLLFAENGLTDHIVPTLNKTPFENPIKRIDLLLHCAQKYLENGQSLQAIDMLHRTTPPDTRLKLWNHYLALAFARTGKADESLALLEEMPETISEARIMLPAFLEMKKWNKALKVLEFLIKETKSEDVLNMMAVILHTKKELPLIKNVMKEYHMSATPFVDTLLKSKPLTLPSTHKELLNALESNKNFRANVEKMLES